MKVEAQYFDVLQNIETAIVSVYEIDAGSLMSTCWTLSMF